MINRVMPFWHSIESSILFKMIWGLNNLFIFPSKSLWLRTKMALTLQIKN